MLCYLLVHVVLFICACCAIYLCMMCYSLVFSEEVVVPPSLFCPVVLCNIQRDARHVFVVFYYYNNITDCLVCRREHVLRGGLFSRLREVRVIYVLYIYI